MNLRRIILAVLLMFFTVVVFSCEEDYEEFDNLEDDLDFRAGTTTYQAENRTFQSGCKQTSVHSGYTGSGFMDYGGNSSLVEWNNVNAPSAGQYRLTFRYANGSAGSRQCVVTLNDTTTAGTLAFVPTGAWTTWSTVSVNATLKAGNNKIRVTANTGSGGPNLDKMDVTSNGDGGTSKCIEVAENKTATLSCSSGQTITSIDFASYGVPTGSCAAGFSTGKCHASPSKSKVQSLCLNKALCTIGANNGTFGDPCPGTFKKLAIKYSCGTGGGGGGDDGYNGSGKLLPVTSGLLNSCDPDEKSVLQSSGFTRVYYGSIGNWTKIITVQGSPKLSQDLVNEVGNEVKRALQPIVERYPDRLRKVLDHQGRTLNFVLIYGSGGGWGAWYDGGGIIYAKRSSARDLDIFHEIGHHFDINNPSTSFRSHVGSILSADDANTIDRYCTYMKPDGTCAYSEFIAENYGKMFYPNQRESVKKEFPVVYERLLKYVPAPSSYVPFAN